MPEKASAFYRPELDVVRFFAFLGVYLTHSLPHKYDRTYNSLLSAGGFGLQLFFTLSAYLITLLLLREQETYGSVHLRKFYLRRALRIWPLYFLGLGLNVAAAWSTGYRDTRTLLQELPFALVMLGNVIPFYPLLGPLWSISVEEQFYVFWPTLMRHLTRRSLFVAAGFIILVANVTLIYLARRHTILTSIWFNSFVNFEFFGCGILLALFEKKRPIFNSVVSASCLLIALSIWTVAGVWLLHVGDPLSRSSALGLVSGYGLVAVACVLILVGFAGFKHLPSPLIYLGKISYGLYVFHGPLLVIGGKHSGHLIPHSTAIICFIATIALASLSYRFFETPFLKQKRKLELVKSRPI